MVVKVAMPQQFKLKVVPSLKGLLLSLIHISEPTRP